MQQTTGLAEVNRLRGQIEQAKTLDELLRIHAHAEFCREGLKIVGASLTKQNEYAEARIRTERKLAEVIDAMREAGELAKQETGRPPACENKCDIVSHLSDFGITRKQSSRWALEARLPEDLFEAYVTETLEKPDVELTSIGVRRQARGYLRELEDLNVPAVVTAISATVASEDALSWLGKIPASSVDLLVTDPPYITEFAADEFELFVARWTEAAWRTLKPTAQAYVCVGAYPDELEIYLRILEVQDILIWTYRNTIGPTPKRSYIRNWQAILYWRGPQAPNLNSTSINELLAVQDISAPDARRNERYYEWQKPDVLCERLVQHASQPGDVVIDPFCGCGSFLIAAAKLGRIAKGTDISPEAIRIAKQRGCIDAA